MPRRFQRLHLHADARALLVQPVRRGAHVTLMLGARADAGNAEEVEQLVAQARVVGVEPLREGGIKRGLGHQRFSMGSLGSAGQVPRQSENVQMRRSVSVSPR